MTEFTVMQVGEPLRIVTRISIPVAFVVASLGNSIISSEAIAKETCKLYSESAAPQAPAIPRVIDAANKELILEIIPNQERSVVQYFIYYGETADAKQGKIEFISRPLVAPGTISGRAILQAGGRRRIAITNETIAQNRRVAREGSTYSYPSFESGKRFFFRVAAVYWLCDSAGHLGVRESEPSDSVPVFFK
ncbi:MAG: hypothetical protein JNJ69_14020 [Leptospiraceae bacterium]|nr:hypothetical protein [Leptospiraceae bacterium]